MRRARIVLGVIIAALLTGFGATACSVADIVGDPQGTAIDSANPDAVKTRAGAVAFYRGVVQAQASALKLYVITTGYLTDELFVASSAGGWQADQRIEMQTSYREQGLYQKLQTVRANARQARGVLPRYAPDLPSSYVAHLYAMEAMADVMLADAFCSGVPLSTIEYGGDFTLRDGSPTTTVYRTAIALFDSAVVEAGDSARIRDFARVGKGRALIAIGDSAGAADAVREVPDDFVYRVEYTMAGTVQLTGNGFDRSAATAPYDRGLAIGATIGDREGTNGLPYASANDARVQLVPNIDQSGATTSPFYVAAKYDASGTTPIVLASGIEARLIEAEAALRNGNVNEWAMALDHLRATAVTPAVPPLTADSTTDASPALRLDVMFRERAFWLFLTGHRQGDLRRLVHHDHRAEATVYPTGIYLGDGNGRLGGVYGTDVTIPVPESERQNNPRYSGCLNREA
jgi:hypothetical protein